MPRIASIGTAVPPYAVSQEKAREFAREMFGRAFCDIDRLLRVFDNANIQKRYFTCRWNGLKSTTPFAKKTIRTSGQRLICRLKQSKGAYRELD